MAATGQRSYWPVIVALIAAVVLIVLCIIIQRCRRKNKCSAENAYQVVKGTLQNAKHFAASLFKKPFLPHGGKFRAEIVGGYMLTGPSIRLKSRLFYRLLLRKGASPFWILAFETIQKELYNEKKDGILQVKQMLSKRCGIWRSV
mgnify:CR=1 FL=1